MGSLVIMCSFMAMKTAYLPFFFKLSFKQSWFRPSRSLDITQEIASVRLGLESQQRCIFLVSWNSDMWSYCSVYFWVIWDWISSQVRCWDWREMWMQIRMGQKGFRADRFSWSFSWNLRSISWNDSYLGAFFSSTELFFRSKMVLMWTFVFLFMTVLLNI